MILLLSAKAFVLLPVLLGGGEAFQPLLLGRFSSTRLWHSSSRSDSETQLDDETTTPRRRELFRVGSLSLASFWFAGRNPLPAAAAAPAAPTTPKTIVVTGANSGVGFEACKRLAASGSGHSIVLACRTLAKAQDAVARIEQENAAATSPDSPWVESKLIPAECDLASLASIQSFAEKLPLLLGNESKIDALCLNAGLARNTAATDVARTEDGFELTVGVNHFGHFYLNNLLLPMVQPSGKIIVTASSVHDPSGPGGAQGEKATLGDMRGLELEGRACEMIDGQPFNADKAYKDSKLCNVLFTRELQRRLEANPATKGIAANCFSPGLIVGTGLFRDQNPVFTKLFDFAATNLLKVAETPAWGGGCLTYMINSCDDRGQFFTARPGASKGGDAVYGERDQFSAVDVSIEAQDDTKAKRFWELTERELGLS